MAGKIMPRRMDRRRFRRDASMTDTRNIFSPRKVVRGGQHL